MNPSGHMEIRKKYWWDYIYFLKSSVQQSIYSIEGSIYGVQCTAWILLRADLALLAKPLS